MNDNLREAIERMKKGEEKGFNEVYANTYNRVYFRARQIMKNEEDAQDLAQTVFIEAYRGIQTLQSAEALNSWLDGITYRQGMKMFRKKKDVLLSEEGEFLLDELESNDISSMPELTADQRATSEIIRGIIEELPQLQKTTVVMYYFDGMKLEQIADYMECSVNTVKSRLHYARNYIREQVEEREEKEGYRLHAIGFPVLWSALKLMADSTVLEGAAVQTLYSGACASVGLQATAIMPGTEAAGIPGAAGTDTGSGNGSSAKESSGMEGNSDLEGDGSQAGRRGGAGENDSPAGKAGSAGGKAGGKAAMGGTAKALCIAAAVAVAGAAIAGILILSGNRGENPEEEPGGEIIAENPESEETKQEESPEEPETEESSTIPESEESEASEESSQEEEILESPEDDIPEADEWGEELYAFLLADDYEAVIQHLGDIPNIREKCAAYEYTEWAWWDYETAYRMKASDGQIFGVIVYEHDSGQQEINAFVSYTLEDGFDYVGYGDHYVIIDESGGYGYIEGGTEFVSNLSHMISYTISEGGPVSVWHM